MSIIELPVERGGAARAAAVLGALAFVLILAFMGSTSRELEATVLQLDSPRLPPQTHVEFAHLADRREKWGWIGRHEDPAPPAAPPAAPPDACRSIPGWVRSALDDQVHQAVRSMDEEGFAPDPGVLREPVGLVSVDQYNTTVVSIAVGGVEVEGCTHAGEVVPSTLRVVARGVNVSALVQYRVHDPWGRRVGGGVAAVDAVGGAVHLELDLADLNQTVQESPRSGARTFTSPAASSITITASST